MVLNIKGFTVFGGGFSGKIIITTLPPISTEGMTVKDMEKLMEKTREVMSATFHETSKEVMQL